MERSVKGLKKKSNKGSLRKKRISLFFIAVLALFLLFASLISGFMLVLVKKPLHGFFEKKYVYKIGADNVKTRKTLSYAKNSVFRDGVMYVNFSYVSELCGFSVSGDNDEFRFFLRNDRADRILLKKGSSTAVLSGASIQMDGKAYIGSNGELFVPCSFINVYIDGISVEADEKNDHRINVLYSSEGEFGLTVSAPDECDTVLKPLGQIQ